MLLLLSGVVVAVHHQVDVVLLDPGGVKPPGSVGNDLVHVAAPDRGHDTLFHREDGSALLSLDDIIGADAHQQVVSKGAGLLQERHMSVVEPVSYHICVHSIKVVPSSCAGHTPLDRSPEPSLRRVYSEDSAKRRPEVDEGSGL